MSASSRCPTCSQTAAKIRVRRDFLRDQRRDASQRGLLVGEPCERLACLGVRDRRRDQLGEVVEPRSVSGGSVGPLGARRASPPTRSPVDHDRTRDRRAMPAVAGDRGHVSPSAVGSSVVEPRRTAGPANGRRTTKSGSSGWRVPACWRPPDFRASSPVRRLRTSGRPTTLAPNRRPTSSRHGTEERLVGPPAAARPASPRAAAPPARRRAARAPRVTPRWRSPWRQLREPLETRSTSSGGSSDARVDRRSLPRTWPSTTIGLATGAERSRAAERSRRFLRRRGQVVLVDTGRTPGSKDVGPGEQVIERKAGSERNRFDPPRDTDDEKLRPGLAADDAGNVERGRIKAEHAIDLDADRREDLCRSRACATSVATRRSAACSSASRGSDSLDFVSVTSRFESEITSAVLGSVAKFTRPPRPPLPTRSGRGRSSSRR